MDRKKCNAPANDTRVVACVTSWRLVVSCSAYFLGVKDVGVINEENLARVLGREVVIVRLLLSDEPDSPTVLVEHLFCLEPCITCISSLFVLTVVYHPFYLQTHNKDALFIGRPVQPKPMLDYVLAEILACGFRRDLKVVTKYKTAMQVDDGVVCGKGGYLDEILLAPVLLGCIVHPYDDMHRSYAKFIMEYLVVVLNKGI